MEKIFDVVFQFATLFTAVFLTGLTVWAVVMEQPPLITFCSALFSALAIFFSTLDIRNWLKK